MVTSPLKHSVTPIPAPKAGHRQPPIRPPSPWASLSLLLALVLTSFPLHTAPSAPVDFRLEIRPILSDRCFTCHGPDQAKRKAGLRLDQRESSTQKLESGHFAIVPGDPKASRLLQVIQLPQDHDDHMPPAKHGKAVTPSEIQRIERWIQEGAAWSDHWAYVAPVRPTPPTSPTTSHPIDAFLQESLTSRGLRMNPEADRITLLRRVSLDLTGLPPTPDEADAFLRDTDPRAYEKQVERLLASPHYGERMALAWLDQARYADTSGYHFDGFRQMHLWRDWVIKAYNDNKPFDQFTIEQLAGDLLPHPTLDQRIATGFHRNVMTTDEGGVDPEEYMAKYCVDRVSTTAQVWLGTTMGCAECHDHKYDPISTREFYQLYAFFHNVSERGLDGTRVRNPAPVIQVPSPDQASRLLFYLSAQPQADRKVADAEAALPKALQSWEEGVRKSAGPHPMPEGLLRHFPEDRSTTNTARLGLIGNSYTFRGSTNDTILPPWTPPWDGTNQFTITAWFKPVSLTGTLLSKMDPAPSYTGWDITLSAGKIEVHLIHHFPDKALKVVSRDPISTNEWHHLVVTYDGSSKPAGLKLHLNGATLATETANDSLKSSIATSSPLRIGSRAGSLPFHGSIEDVRFYDRPLEPLEAFTLFRQEIRRIAWTPAEKRTAEQSAELKRFFRAHEYTALLDARKQVSRLKEEKDKLMSEIPDTMVMDEREQPRDTFVLVRGDFQHRGEKVGPGIPACWPPLPASPTTNRLTLARWIVSDQNPLTARVTVNRLWAQFFGTGIVKTSNDFGSQGDAPSHPGLLDWLACEFQSPTLLPHPALRIAPPSRWDQKHLVRLIVTSAAYRQSAQVTAEKLEKDPYNRLISRGPRNRLEAELIRDNALAISGLLDRRIGGPSIKPYQPPGIWSGTDHQYEQSKGQDLYRRGLYVFWKRAAHYPSFQTFDAPSRETCTLLRPRTSTPLQSLVLMNDPVYVEAARALAARAMMETGPNHPPQEQILHAFRLTLARTPADEELQSLIRTFDAERDRFEKEPREADALLAVGESPVPTHLNRTRLAALTGIANILLNLNETITR